MPSARWPTSARLIALTSVALANFLAAATLVPSAAHAAIGDITTIAGTGTQGEDGDGGPATSATLSGPLALAVAADGSIIDADQYGARVRKIAPDGTITKLAGTTQGFGGDGGPATSAKLDVPSGLGVLPDGTILVADINNNRVRAISPSGAISTVAGNGSAGGGGDGGLATSASVEFPYDAQPIAGGYLIADQDDHHIRKVNTADGKISTVAGNGSDAATGDGGLATAAAIGGPSGIAVLPDGGFLFTDFDNNVIRKVAADGKISTVAGGGPAPGDNVAATSVQLNGPVKIALLHDGSFVFTEAGANKVRRVADGTITTIAGTGTAGYNGDNIPAKTAQLKTPYGLAVAPDGDVLIADTNNHRIRRVDLGDTAAPPTPTSAPVPTPAPSDGKLIRPAFLTIPPGLASAALLNVSLTPKSPLLPTRAAAVASPAAGTETLQWDVSGDGKPDVTCPGDEPAIAITAPKSTSYANASVTAASGPGLAGTLQSKTTGPTSGRISMGTATPGRGLALLGGHTARKAIASRAGDKRISSKMFVASCGVDLSVVQIALDVFDLKACTQQTVVFALVDFRGCLFNRIGNAPTLLNHEIAAVRASRRDLSSSAPLNGWYTDKPLMLNGMKISPVGTAEIGVLPDYERVVARNVSVTLGDLTLQKSGPLDWDLNSHGKGDSFLNSNYTTQQLFTVPGKGMTSIGGFPRVGQVSVALTRDGPVRGTAATINLQLPSEFSALGSLPPATSTKILADNQYGVRLDQLNVKASSAGIGPITLQNINFVYYPNGKAGSGCGSNYWEGSAVAHLGPSFLPTTSFNLAPTPQLPRNGIGYCGTHFDHAGGQYTFGGGSEIFPAVRLLDINFGIGIDPPLLRGGGTIQAGFAKINGQIVIVGATPSSPYTLSAADGAGFGLPGIPQLRSPSVGVSGDLTLSVPVIGSLDLARGYVVYQAPDLVSIGGATGFNAGVFSINGNVYGSASTLTGKFNVSGRIQGCLFPVIVGDLCGTVQAFVSSKGVSVCAGDLNDDFNPGIGYAWGAPFAEVWWYINGEGGCKPSHYWITNVRAARATAARSHDRRVRASAARAGGAVSFTVEKGETRKNVQITGTGGEPSVQVTGPGGITLSTASSSLVQNDHIAIVRPGKGDNTYIGVLNGPPGTYTVTPVDGSAPIAGIAATRPGGDANPTGKLRKLPGGKYELDYDAGPSGGKTITFVATGGTADQVLGTSSGGKGSLRFTPALGPKGTRTIVARVVVDGVPAPDVNLATFSVASTLAAGKPGPLKVKLTAKGLSVSWGKADRAASYAVRVTSSTGAEQVVLVAAKAHKATVPGVALDSGGKVTVLARGTGGGYGPKQTAKYAATKVAANVIVRGENHRKK